MIKLENVSKKFGTGVYALSEVSFEVEKGEFVFLVGPTGSGKTTVFKLLIKDLAPTEGKVIVNEVDLSILPKDKLPVLRKKIGVVFQDLKLMPDRTVLENILLPLDIMGKNEQESEYIVKEALEQVGLSEHKDKFPLQLSGGELQRVAIARALVLSPEILLADEPTGNLDDEKSWEIVKILSEINEKGTTILMATHNNQIIKSLGKRVIHLDKGKLLKDEKDKKHKKDDKKDKDREKDEKDNKDEQKDGKEKKDEDKD